MSPKSMLRWKIFKNAMVQHKSGKEIYIDRMSDNQEYIYANETNKFNDVLKLISNNNAVRRLLTLIFSIEMDWMITKPGPLMCVLKKP